MLEISTLLCVSLLMCKKSEKKKYERYYTCIMHTEICGAANFVLFDNLCA